MTPACWHCHRPCLAFVREYGIDYHLPRCGRSWAVSEGRG